MAKNNEEGVIHGVIQPEVAAQLLQKFSVDEFNAIDKDTKVIRKEVIHDYFIREDGERFQYRNLLLTFACTKPNNSLEVQKRQTMTAKMLKK